MDEPPFEPLIDALESDVRALCSPERAWAEPHVADVVLPGEDPVAFVVIRVRLEERIRPEGELEREAILTITAARWRRWRIERVYKALMEVTDGPVHDRERRSRLAACRAERAGELRIEQAAAAEIRRSKRASADELKGRAIPETKAMRAQAEEHEYRLDEARRALRAAEERARAAEALLAERAGAASAPAPADDHDAMHPSEENMKPWLVLMGEGGAAPAAAPARPPPGTAAAAMAARLARKLAGEEVEEEAWSGTG